MLPESGNRAGCSTKNQMASLPPTPGLPAQWSTRAVFFMLGFSTAAWAPLIPFIKTRLSLSENTLGLLLLCIGVGSMVTMPLAGALAARVGCRVVMVVSTVLICAVLPLLTVLSSVPVLGAVLALFGAGIGSLDCVMNIQAILVERASGRAMMSGFHGAFSLGGLAGAAGVIASLSAGASPLAAASGVAAATLLALVFAARHFLPYGSTREGPAFAVPHGVVLFIGLLCFVVFLAEGSVTDWSAVFLTGLRGMAPSHAGLGYVAFALTMTVCRLAGDPVVQRLGGRNVMALGGSIAAGGMALAALVPSWRSGLLGYVLVGVGCCNLVPVLFTAAGRQRAMPENVAMPAVTTLGYAGILAGPAAIGFIAHAVSLPVAFLTVAALLLGVAASGRVLPAD